MAYDVTRAAWLLKASATFQDTKDRTTGEALLRRPDRKASVTLDRKFPDGSWVGAEWFYSSERKDFGGVSLDSYQLINLRAGWAVTSSWRLEVRGENLTDEAYEPAFGFSAMGRAWFLSVAWLP